MNKKVVLGFSGGLDTTFCAKHLAEDMGYEVHSIVVNTGGFTDDELKRIEAHAYKLGGNKKRNWDVIPGFGFIRQSNCRAKCNVSIKYVH